MTQYVRQAIEKRLEEAECEKNSALWLLKTAEARVQDLRAECILVEQEVSELQARLNSMNEQPSVVTFAGWNS